MTFLGQRPKIYSGESVDIAEKICQSVTRGEFDGQWARTSGIKWKQDEVAELVQKRCPRDLALRQWIWEMRNPPPPDVPGVLTFGRPLVFPQEERRCYRCHGEEGQFEDVHVKMYSDEARRRPGCREVSETYCLPPIPTRRPEPTLPVYRERPPATLFPGPTPIPTGELVMTPARVPITTPRFTPTLTTQRPGIPTSPAWSQPAIPVSSAAEPILPSDVFSEGQGVTTGQCPIGQFPAYPGGPCRGAIATGGLPGLPGGFPSGGGVQAPTLGSRFRGAFLPKVPLRRSLGSQHHALGQGTPILRFIVTDEAGENFVPGALVSIVFEDGTLLVSKRVDAGGNAAFSKEEILGGAAKAGLEEARGVAWYTVEAPGYALQDAIVWDPSKPVDEQLNKIYTIALKKIEAPAADAAPYIAGVALLTALGLVLHFSK